MRERRRSGAAEAMADGNADWMGSLPPALRSLPLSNLAIPGRAAARGAARAVVGELPGPRRRIPRNKVLRRRLEQVLGLRAALSTAAENGGLNP